MAPTARIEKLGMTPLRALFFVTMMPIAIVCLLIGLGWMAMASVLSGRMSLSTVPVEAFGLTVLGAVATGCVAHLRHGSGRFGRALRTRASEIALAKFVRIR